MLNEKGRRLTRMNFHCLSEKLHGRKVILCLWWDHRGIIDSAFLNCNKPLNVDLYSQKL